MDVKVSETARYLASYLEENWDKYSVCTKWHDYRIDVDLLAKTIQEFYDTLP